MLAQVSELRPGLETLSLEPWQWLGLAGLAAGALAVAAGLQWLLVRLARWIASRTRPDWDDKLVAIFPAPAWLFLGLVLFHMGLSLLNLPPPARETVGLVVRVLLIIIVTWLASRLLSRGAEIMQALLARQVADENRLRSLQTQIAVPRAILRFVIILVGVALVLMQFEVVRSLGISLMASAGLAGIIVGLAAQRTLGNILAGIQLAFFQPIRIGDTVVVESEQGTIEEIGLTYVVVKIWDERRLIVPVSQFLEKPFQNLTKVGSELQGTVSLYGDYSLPVDEVRAEVRRILDGTELWDKRSHKVEVTNLTERSVELRIAVSARNSSTLGDLRCLLREKLLAWLQTKGKGYLPVERVELQSGDKQGSAR